MKNADIHERSLSTISHEMNGNCPKGSVQLQVAALEDAMPPSGLIALALVSVRF